MQRAADLHPIMYTGMEPGGQLTTTTDVENFPGYPDGVTGPAMMEELKQQAERFGTEVRFGLVTKAELSNKEGGWHKLIVDENTEIEARTVIISTGATAKYLGLEAEQKYAGHGVSACAVCDGFFFKGKDVVIVGGGDTAAEEATYLAKLCGKVTMLVRREELRASKAMQNRVFATENIEVLWNTEAVDLEGTGAVETVVVKNNQTNETSRIAAQGFFLAIGHQPNTDLFKDQLEMDDTGYLNHRSRLNGNASAWGFCLGGCAGQGVSTGSYCRGNGMHGGSRSRAISGHTRLSSLSDRFSSLPKIQEGRPDDVQTFIHLCCSQHQWRCKADDIAVGWLGQQAIFL